MLKIIQYVIGKTEWTKDVLFLDFVKTIYCNLITTIEETISFPDP